MALSGRACLTLKDHFCDFFAIKSMERNQMSLDKKKMNADWVLQLIRDLNQEQFTGSIRINFFKGDISKKIEKTSFISGKE